MAKNTVRVCNINTSLNTNIFSFIWLIIFCLLKDSDVSFPPSIFLVVCVNCKTEFVWPVSQDYLETKLLTPDQEFNHKIIFDLQQRWNAFPFLDTFCCKRAWKLLRWVRNLVNQIITKLFFLHTLNNPFINEDKCLNQC